MNSNALLEKLDKYNSQSRECKINKADISLSLLTALNGEGETKAKQGSLTIEKKQ